MHAFHALSRIAFVIGVAVIGTNVAAQGTLRSPDNPVVARALAHIASFPAVSSFGPDQNFRVRDVIVDADGTEHVRFDRQYRGLPVIGGDLVVHTAPNGMFRSVSATLARALNLSVRPSIRSAQASQAALVAQPGDTRGVPPALVVYARGDLPTLAYDVRVFGEQADGTPMEKHVIVDANRGVVLDAWDDIHTGKPDGSGARKGGGGSGGGTTGGGSGGTTGPTASAGLGNGYYYAGVEFATTLRSSDYELSDPGGEAPGTAGTPYHTYDFRNGRSSMYYITDADNAWGTAGNLSDRQSVAVDAHYGSWQTLQFYASLGRAGIDPSRTDVAKNGVHYGRNYNNAFWSDSCFCMVYGDGDGNVFNPLVSLDVAGHEMTHGVTSATAGLIYSGESGGLNEATSDIMGTMVELFANHANDVPDYQIGEKIVGPGFGRAYLRNMQQPSSDGRSADCYYPGVGSLDVHYSSGVANHFFYLLAEGSANSKTCKAGDGRVATGGSGALTVYGIGADKAAQIWYEALTLYMTSDTDFAGARAATLAVASSRFGDTSSEVANVEAAWLAVNVK